MKKLNIDIETYSEVDLLKSGTYPYCEHESFEILLFGYSVDEGPVKCVDFASGQKLPKKIYNALFDPAVEKHAWNAMFERLCLSTFFGREIPASQWYCTMVRSAMIGLPLKLDAAGKALNIENQKLSSGTSLINLFSKPCKPTKANEMRTRNMPWHKPDKWQQYIDYNIKDVEAELEIFKKLEFYQVPAKERKLYLLDQEINDKGVRVDTTFARNAISMNKENVDALTKEAKKRSGIANPQSVAQLKQWLLEQTGEEHESLSAENVREIIKSSDSEIVRFVMQYRIESSKSSIRKYNAMINTAGRENRSRGMFQYYGANRTGRWSSRGIQLQNLARNKMKDWDLKIARELVLSHDLETMKLLYPDVSDTLSQLIRTSFVPKPGHIFAVSDFAAIEARVIAWLADERWRMQVFETHGMIYEASASQMFGVPIEQIMKGGIRADLRAKGKIAELACGFGGGVNALIRMGADKMGVAEEDMQDIIDLWRETNSRIVGLWKIAENAFRKVLKQGGSVEIFKGITVKRLPGRVVISLPSGRDLSYVSARLVQGKKGTQIAYQGVDQVSKKWGMTTTWGGKLVENIVQAIARDCLCHSLVKIVKAKYDVVLTIHDEIVTEVPKNKNPEQKLQQMFDIMAEPVPWAPGLKLTADGHLLEFYQKKD